MLPGLPRIDETITKPRACVRCGYNLLGLKTGGRCPECATPIKPDVLRGVPSMTEAPLPYLRAMAAGAMRCAAGMAAMMVGVLWYAGFVGVPEYAPGATLLLAIGGSLWCWGTQSVLVRRVMPPGSKVDTQHEWARFRTVTRVMQWAFPLAGVVLFLIEGSNAAMSATLAGSTKPLSASLPVLAAQAQMQAAVLTVVGLVCFAAISMAMAYVALLAEWAGDTSLARSLGMAPILMLISIPVAIATDMVAPSLGSKGVLVVVLPVMGFLSAALVYLGSFWILPVVRFAWLTRWAVRNVQESHAKDARTTAKIVDRIESAKAKDEPKPASRTAARRAPTADAGAGAYELAPEDS